MSEFKDLFSRQSTNYAHFRPTYPPALFSYLTSLAPRHQMAWDCGTGSGQAAIELTRYFDQVMASDPSQKQLDKAVKHPKIQYRQGAAENSGLKPASVDLITVAQAFHWFKQKEFFQEVNRILVPGGILAFWCYELVKITPAVDAVIWKYYSDILGPYWEKERKLVEEGYKNVELPMTEVTPPPIEMHAEWSFEHLLGYLSTWSALQSYIQKNGSNPLEQLFPELKSAWGKVIKYPVRWELGLRIGRQ